MCAYCGNPKAWPSCDWVIASTAFILAVAAVVLMLSSPAWAGQPDYPNQMMQQQYVADVVQTVREQGVPKGDIIKQLVLAFIEDIGYVKALLWLMLLPLAGIVVTVFGAMKLFRKKA